MKIGVLGGTFNPIHLGHLILADECLHQLGLDKVVFIPTGLPPHKTIEGDIAPADRLNMVRLALEGYGRFEISTYEIDKNGFSYSIETIKHLKTKYGEYAELFFLAGEDSGDNLSLWKDFKKILRFTTFVVANRPGVPVGAGPARPINDYIKDNLTSITIPDIDISSTMIRERIKHHEPIDFYIPPKVVDYIRNKGLYT
ncbi:MAG: nicotinate-nucleotide adenylyltransferase [Candidatus Omnitrophica bacterium]|nr:nicotinate-nucleotide adenylyltransferase [Candidatus Omnitrophota bacterium]